MGRGSKLYFENIPNKIYKYFQLYRFVNSQPCLLLCENPEGWDVVRNAFQLLAFINCHLPFLNGDIERNLYFQLQIKRPYLRDSAGYHCEMQRAKPRQGNLMIS